MEMRESESPVKEHHMRLGHEEAWYDFHEFQGKLLL